MKISIEMTHPRITLTSAVIREKPAAIQIRAETLQRALVSVKLIWEMEVSLARKTRNRVKQRALLQYTSEHQFSLLVCPQFGWYIKQSTHT